MRKSGAARSGFPISCPTPILSTLIAPFSTNHSRIRCSLSQTLYSCLLRAVSGSVDLVSSRPDCLISLHPSGLNPGLSVLIYSHCAARNPVRGLIPIAPQRLLELSVRRRVTEFLACRLPQVMELAVNPQRVGITLTRMPTYRQLSWYPSADCTDSLE